MRFEELVVRDVEGERHYDEARLPLRVGTGSDCQLRLPGPGGEPVALLDLLDGLPFVQPVGRNTALQINGVPLETSRRLVDGDVLQFFGSEIRVAVDDVRIALDVHLEDSAYVTRPPVAPDAGTRPDEETIAPTAFRRAAATALAEDTSKRSPLKFIVGGALIALLTMSYLLFTAVSVEFEIDPGQPDRFDIDGGWFRLPVGGRVLLREGNYTVNVEKKGYYDIGQTFVVGDDPSMTVRLRMRKKPGQLRLVTDPVVDAVVTIDDSMVGKAPYGPVQLEPGEHTVRVESERFLPFNDFIRVTGLDRVEILHVQLTPRWANVEVTSEPAGATIFSGDEEVGVTPATVELLEGTHELTVVKDGFSAWDGNIVAEPNVGQKLPLIRLQAANAKLHVNTIPRGANVTVNGRYRGQSPITLSLTPDVDYEIGMSKAGYGVTSRNLRLQSAASESITVDMTARVGTVTLFVEPSDATIYVDGRARGTGKTTLRLSSAPHRIDVKRQGFADWTQTITPRPGYPQTLTARLAIPGSCATRLGCQNGENSGGTNDDSS